MKYLKPNVHFAGDRRVLTSSGAVVSPDDVPSFALREEVMPITGEAKPSVSARGENLWKRTA